MNLLHRKAHLFIGLEVCYGDLDARIVRLHSDKDTTPLLVDMICMEIMSLIWQRPGANLCFSFWYWLKIGFDTYRTHLSCCLASNTSQIRPRQHWWDEIRSWDSWVECSRLGDVTSALWGAVTKGELTLDLSLCQQRHLNTLCPHKSSCPPAEVRRSVATLGASF